MASKRRLRRKRCEAKVPHAEYQSALEAARKFGDDMQPYHCSHCGYWHVGHRIGLHVEPRGFKGRMGRW